jgi:hypothetical protein
MRLDRGLTTADSVSRPGRVRWCSVQGLKGLCCVVLGVKYRFPISVRWSILPLFLVFLDIICYPRPSCFLASLTPSPHLFHKLMMLIHIPSPDDEQIQQIPLSSPPNVIDPFLSYSLKATTAES